MKQIICPTDFSPTATKAVNFAAWMAQRLNAQLTLVHAVQLHLLDNEEGVAANTQAVAAQLHQAERTLHDTCHALEKKFRGEDGASPLQCQVQVKEALLTDTLSRFPADSLVIMGTTGGGADKLEDLMLGSNAASVMRNVTVPVLVLPAASSGFKLEKVIFATDYGPEDQQSLFDLIELVKPFRSQIHLLHVSIDDTEEQEQQFQEFCRPIAQQLKYSKMHFQRISNSDVEEGILEYATQMHADLLALPRKAHSIFERLFSQSLAEQLSYHSDIPVLTLPYNTYSNS